MELLSEQTEFDRFKIYLSILPVLSSNISTSFSFSSLLDCLSFIVICSTFLNARKILLFFIRFMFTEARKKLENDSFVWRAICAMCLMQLAIILNELVKDF